MGNWNNLLQVETSCIFDAFKVNNDTLLLLEEHVSWGRRDWQEAAAPSQARDSSSHVSVTCDRDLCPWPVSVTCVRDLCP